MDPRTWRWLRVLGLPLLVGFAALNALAYGHAYTLTHFASGGRPTPKPETLSLAERIHTLFTGAVIPRPKNRTTPEAFGLPYETRVIPEGGGPALEAWLVPRPESRGFVILFHGYVDSKDSLLPEARAFRDMGYSALLVDFRGSGGSGGQETSIGFHEATDVARALEYARQLAGGRPVVLYGASMGAVAVLKAVGDHALRPDALVLASPFDRLLTTVRHRFEILGVPSFPSAHMLVFWGGVQQGFSGFAHNPVDYARRVDSPALLMHGGRDARVSIAEARAIFEALKGPKVFKSFEGLGHESFLKARPEAWRAAVSGFLDGLGEAR